MKRVAIMAFCLLGCGGDPFEVAPPDIFGGGTLATSDDASDEAQSTADVVEPKDSFHSGDIVTRDAAAADVDATDVVDACTTLASGRFTCAAVQTPATRAGVELCIVTSAGYWAGNVATPAACLCAPTCPCILAAFGSMPGADGAVCGTATPMRITSCSEHATGELVITCSP